MAMNNYLFASIEPQTLVEHYGEKRVKYTDVEGPEDCSDRIGRITGSNLPSLLDLRCEKTIRHIRGGPRMYPDRVAFHDAICRMYGLSPSKEIPVEFLEWGKNHELPAVATLLEEYPELKYRNHPFTPYEADFPIGCTPDGTVTIGDSEYVLEIKCPAVFLPGGRDRLNVSPYERIPWYYVPQISLEMIVMGVPQALFVSWTPCNGTRMWTVKEDTEYSSLLLDVLRRIYFRYLQEDTEVCKMATDTSRHHDPEALSGIVWDVDGYKELVEMTLQVADKWSESGRMLSSTLGVPSATMLHVPNERPSASVIWCSSSDAV